MEEKRKEAATITAEFKQKFTKLPARLRTLRTSQRARMQELKAELKPIEMLQGYSENVITYLASAYLFVVTEEILQVPPTNFIEDLNEFTRQRGENLFEMIETNPDTVSETTLTRFINAIGISSAIVFEAIRWIVHRFGIKWREGLIKSFLLSHNFKTIMQEVYKECPELDIRFIAAIARVTTDDFIDRRLRILQAKALGNASISRTYQELCKVYPFDKGEEFFFDIVWKHAFEPTWLRITQLIEEEVGLLQERMQQQKEEMDEFYRATLEHEKVRHSDGSYSSLLSMKIFEIFELDSPVDETRGRSIVSAVDVLIRRFSVDTFGYASGDPEVLIRMALNLLWETLAEAPQALIPLLEPLERFELSKAEDEFEWIKEREGLLRSKFDRYLRRGLGEKPSYIQIGESFVELLRQAKESSFQLRIKRRT
ncbi:MAG: hypothetical protein ACFFBD_02720 [Candidatus Hodarchaeota archaeon]